MLLVLVLMVELLGLRGEHGGRNEGRRSARSSGKGRRSTGTSCVGGRGRLIEARGPAPRVNLTTSAGVGGSKVVARSSCWAGGRLLGRGVRSDEILTCSSSNRAVHARLQDAIRWSSK